MDLRAWFPISIALALSAATGNGQPESPAAPFASRNEHPIGLLYGVPTGIDSAGHSFTGLEVRVAIDVVNCSYESYRKGIDLVLDGETWSTRLVFRQGFRNGWRVALQIPVISHVGGGTDKFIEEYHDDLGFPQGNRDWRSPGRLEYVYRRGDETVFRRTESASGLGDVRLSLSAPLWKNPAGTRTLEVAAGAELPTGDPDLLLGSGSTDVSLGLAGGDSESLSRWNLELQAAAGLLAMTAGDVMDQWQRSTAGYGSLSIAWRLADWLVPRLQIDGHGPLFSGTEMDPFDDGTVQVGAGATLRLPGRFCFDVSVVEDMCVPTAPDVVFHFSLSRVL